jgi:aminomuconate-semialdehyde/2-hydroxymuconate-6-semialdehyde dehydrogenase
VHELTNFVDGVFRPAERGWLDDVDPAVGRPWARLPDSDASDVAAAVGAATRAFPAWSSTPAAERSRLLLAKHGTSPCGARVAWSA